MARIIHVCQNIKGALKNWTMDDWYNLAESNGLSYEELVQHFRIADFEGKKVLPIGEKCEGFSYETGCPGHDDSTPAERTAK